MKLRRAFALLLCCIVSVVTLGSSNVVEAKETHYAKLMFKSGGSTHTHQYIVNTALKILKNDKGSTALNTEDIRDNILYFCDWPDTIGNETDSGTYAGHFYDPDTGKNWMGQTSPTAKGRALTYFNSAVSDYKNGDKDDAYKCLGKGLHYVADLNEPHHASNLTALNSNHTEFEKYVDKNRTSFTIPGNTLSNSIYTTATSKSVSTFLQSSAVYAKSLAGIAQDSSTYYTAGDKCVTQAIKCSVEYIYKFCVQVGIY